MIIVDVFVPGAAKTKGSMEVRNRATGTMKESVEGSSRWRALMAQAVRDDIAWRNPDPPRPEARCMPWPGPVAVTVVAYLTPPGSWWQDALRDLMQFRWPTWNRAGDLDKIVRNVLDAIAANARNRTMNGGAIVDDNLVCRIVAEKHTAGVDGAQAGVRIVVETL